MAMIKSVLVTGANGFIGRNVCRFLANSGYSVRGSLRAGSEGPRDGITYVRSGEIDATTDWRPLLEGIEGIVHTAARVHVVKETEPDPLSAFRRINTFATRRLAEQAAESGVRRFVFLSSIGVASVENQDAGQLDPVPYQVSKWEAERALLKIAEKTGLELVALRPPLVYGPGAPGNFKRLVDAIARGLPLPLGSIRNRHSFVFVGNLASAVEKCLSHHEIESLILAVSDGEDISTPELARRIAGALGCSARLLPCPPELLRWIGRIIGRQHPIESLIGDLVIDNREICERLDWHPPTDPVAAMAASVGENRVDDAVAVSAEF